MSRSWKCLFLTLAAALGLVSSASAGNIVLTGHDDDLHTNFDGGALSMPGQQLNAMVAFARNGSSLPVLTFDHGTQLTTALTLLGIPFTNVDPDAGTPAASLFNHSVFSAIVVASDETCGGCDNTATSIANLTNATSKTNFANFVNAGGGLVGLAGAARSGTYYGFVPNSVGAVGVALFDGFFQTPDGLIAGIPAVNGDEEHNLFPDPGTGGLDPLFKVFERNSGEPAGLDAATVGITGAVISVSGFVGVPEPGTLTLAGLALLGAAGYRLRRRKQNA